MAWKSDDPRLVSDVLSGGMLRVRDTATLVNPGKVNGLSRREGLALRRILQRDRKPSVRHRGT